MGEEGETSRWWKSESERGNGCFGFVGTFNGRNLEFGGVTDSNGGKWYDCNLQELKIKLTLE